ncbi:MAG: glycerophosphodiester phosphodiesterase [Clostridia bacterium]|nr:glycerophosphodiester phosphodiesterase [Clostridia bacterium]
MLFVYISAAGIVLFAFYLFCIAPAAKSGKMQPFENKYIAHRGLFDNENGVPENSLLSFENAAKNGYGIELDIQRTTDDELVVFHDDSTGRLCGEDICVCGSESDKLRSLKLLDTDERIPLFKEMLKTVDGRVPLFIEIKPKHDNAATVELMMEELKGYKGAYCVQSFNPFALRYIRKKYPRVPIGQLSTNLFDDNREQPLFYKITVGSLLVNFISRPDFLSYNIKYANRSSYKIYRTFFKTSDAVWTARSAAENEKAKKLCSIIIFDKYT